MFVGGLLTGWRNTCVAPHLLTERAENHLRDINMKSTTKKLVVFSSLVVTGLAAPVAFSSAHGVSANNACADPIQTGTCCPQNLSLCNAGGGDHQDYYYKETGPC